MTPQEQYDLIGMPLNGLLGQLCGQLGDLCECIKNYSATGTSPCWTERFRIRGAVSQLTNQDEVTNVFQVPKGLKATITSVTFAERWPGALYGGSFTLLINEYIHPSFPRMDHPVGIGMEMGVETRICLDEQDVVSILIECAWSPIQIGQDSDYVEMIWPFELSGYYELKEVSP